MSQAPGDIHSLPPSVSEHTDDGMNLTKIIVVGVISLVIFALSAVVAWWILKDDQNEYRARGMAEPPVGLTKKAEYNIVDTAHFDDDHRLEAWKALKAKQATSYGWADRAKGLVHIPIEEAIKDVVREAAAHPPGQPSRTVPPINGGTPGGAGASSASATGGARR